MKTSPNVTTTPGAVGGTAGRRIAWAACLLMMAAVVVSPALVQAQCPAGTGSATFEWSTSAGSGNEWTTANQSTGDSQVYTVNYTDAYGNPNTLNVTVTLQDPDGMNFDNNFSCPAGAGTCGTGATGTNQAYGPGFLTVYMAAGDSADTVGLDFGFSKPVTMSDFSVGDIDDVGYNFQPAVEPGHSYQDQVSFSATLGGSNVPITLVGGSNMTIAGQTATAIVELGVNGNVEPTDPEGTLTASTTEFFDTFNFSYNNGPEDATNEGGPGASNSHAVRLSGFELLCVLDTAPALSINKTSSPSGVVLPGQTITYTIEVSNAGPGNANDVVVTDTLPTGVTYVSGSTTATYDAPGSSDSVGDDFSSGGYSGFTGTNHWTGAWTESDTSGNYIDVEGGRLRMEEIWGEYIQRTADLSSFPSAQLSFDWETISLESGEQMTVRISTDGSSWTNLGSFGGSTTGTFSHDISAFISSTTYIRFDNVGSNWSDRGDQFFFDNLSISYTGPVGPVTLDNSGGGNPQLDDGTPPNLVTAGDGITLPPGETMTVTFDVVVDDPLDPAITELTNSSSATAQGITTPVTDTATNPVGTDADVSVAKTLVTAGPYSPGQTVTYTLVVSNAGPLTATNVTVYDAPTNLTITGVSGGGCASLPCVIPSIAVGGSVTITVTATVQ